MIIFLLQRIVDRISKGVTTMKTDEILQLYKDLIPFLSQVLGTDTEIALHDLRNMDRSLIAIENNLTNREVGARMTDYGRELATSTKYKDLDLIPEYRSQYKNLHFISYEYIIKNGEERIGMLCINKNSNTPRDLQLAVNKLLKTFKLELNDNAPVAEKYDTDIMDILRSRLDMLIADTGMAVNRLSKEEKTKIVKQLSDEGLLRMQGAMPEVAEKLQVSLPTLYRYLKD